MKSFRESYLYRQMELVLKSPSSMFMISLLSCLLRMESNSEIKIVLAAINDSIQLSFSPADEPCDNKQIVMLINDDSDKPLYYKRVSTESRVIEDTILRINTVTDCLSRIDKPIVLHMSKYALNVKTDGIMTGELCDILMNLV